MSVANQPSDGSTPYAIGLLGALGALVFGRSRRRQK
jgi:MYXO-CTERM domain-containing protein